MKMNETIRQANALILNPDLDEFSRRCLVNKMNDLREAVERALLHLDVLADSFDEDSDVALINSCDEDSDED